MFQADTHTGRLQIRRTELVETDDSGEFQRVTALGYADETFKLAHRVQPFGISSNPPKGSHGLAMLVNGRPDQTVLLGVEHPEHRPRNLPVGCKAVYNAHGDIISLVQQNIRIKSARIDLNPP